MFLLALCARVWQDEGMKNLVKTTAAIAACFSVTSCSLFSSSTQTIRIETNSPQCVIKADGETVGGGTTATAKLKKNKTHVITAQHGNKRGMAVVESSLSTTGILDIIGGIWLIVPFLGFLSKGAWELEPEAVTIELD